MKRAPDFNLLPSGEASESHWQALLLAMFAHRALMY